MSILNKLRLFFMEEEPNLEKIRLTKKEKIFLEMLIKEFDNLLKLVSLGNTSLSDIKNFKKQLIEIIQNNLTKKKLIKNKTIITLLLSIKEELKKEDPNWKIIFKNKKNLSNFLKTQSF